MKPIIRRIILGAALCMSATLWAVPKKGAEFGEPTRSRIEKEVENQCGVAFHAPNGLNIALVQKTHAQTTERCVLALTRSGNSTVASLRGVNEGYFEEADLILVVKSEPANDRLEEFHFSPPLYPEQPVKYIKQPLTDIAKRMGYSQESVISFKVTRGQNGVLYTGSARVTQRNADGVQLEHRRLDVLWGNSNVSIGATVWCTKNVAHDCEFQRLVKKLFGTFLETDSR